MPAFMGLDLAWTTARESGLCIAHGDEAGLEVRVLEALVRTPLEFAELASALGTDVVVAIDAPLLVTEERRAERGLATVFGAYRASAYTAKLPFLTRMGGMAGPQLARELRAAGFCLDPFALSPGARGRFAFETYPHAGHVVHFALSERLKYKKGPLPARRAGLQEYRDHLWRFIASPGPLLRMEGGVEELLTRRLDGLGGTALKRVEDTLDGLSCALLAYEAWRNGIARGDVFGSADAGCIVVPGASRDARLRRATSAVAPSSP